jgi:hypothetical protein
LLKRKSYLQITDIYHRVVFLFAYSKGEMTSS